jgi:DNA-binding NarL/FixJ family response regulator
MIRVLAVDDHPLLREGIAALVNAESDLKLVADATNGQDAIEKFRLHRPDVTLMDLQMLALSGIDAIIGIRSEFPNARIIVLMTYTGEYPGVTRSESCVTRPESWRSGLHLEGTRA